MFFYKRTVHVQLLLANYSTVQSNVGESYSLQSFDRKTIANLQQQDNQLAYVAIQWKTSANQPILQSLCITVLVNQTLSVHSMSYQSLRVNTKRVHMYMLPPNLKTAVSNLTVPPGQISSYIFPAYLSGLASVQQQLGCTGKARLCYQQVALGRPASVSSTELHCMGRLALVQQTSSSSQLGCTGKASSGLACSRLHSTIQGQGQGCIRQQ